MTKYRTITDVKKAHKEEYGGFFFNKEVMKTWNSRVHNKVFPDASDGAYFVTSEYNEENGPERYTVRYIDSSGGIRGAVSSFREHAHLQDALDQARELARG